MCLLLTSFLYSQDVENFSTEKIQYGFSIKVNISFNNLYFDKKNGKTNEPCVAWRVSGNAGIAKAWLSRNLYPSLNSEFLLYNSGFGSNSLPIESDEPNKPNKIYKSNKRKFNVDAIIALTVTQGFQRNNSDFETMVPLRYFSDFTFPALKNPYRYSFSLGSNLIIPITDKNKQKQRIGFLNANVTGVQISYYNDGTPFGKIFLGDGEDRYYTGGGTLSFDQNFKDSRRENYMVSLEVSYHKFTGFNKSAFEFCSTIGNSLVDYGDDEDQIYYNKSVWRGSAFLQSKNIGYGLTFSQNNSAKYDGQSFIHLLISNDSFHFIPYNRHYSFDAFSFINLQKFEK